MEIYTIKIDRLEDSLKIKAFIKELIGARVSVIKEKTTNPACVTSLADFRKQIAEAQEDVAMGNVISHEELKKIAERW